VPRILNLKSGTEGVSVKVVGELNRPPYEKGNAGAALFEHAKTLAAENRLRSGGYIHRRRLRRQFHGTSYGDTRWLGVDGQGAHTHYEQMYISSIEPRARLLHRLYQTLR